MGFTVIANFQWSSPRNWCRFPRIPNHGVQESGVPTSCYRSAFQCTASNQAVRCSDQVLTCVAVTSASAPLGGTQRVFRNKMAKDPTLLGRKVLENESSERHHIARAYPSHVESLRKTFLFATTSIQKRTIMQTEVEKKNLVGGLLALTAEGDSSTKIK